jgi:hypothetical protein
MRALHTAQAALAELAPFGVAARGSPHARPDSTGS